MRIAYCTNVRLPSERAHGHQVAHVCDALAQLGHEVHVFCPYRLAAIAENFATYYGVDKTIRLHTVGTFDPIAACWLPGVLGLWVLNALLGHQLSAELAQFQPDLCYTRSPALVPALLTYGKPVIVELHQLPRFGRAQFVRQCNRCAVVACLTSVMKQKLVSWGVESDRIQVAPDAVDLRRFADLPDIQSARATLGIKTSRLVVGYVGRLKTLGQEKGVGILLQSLKQLQASQQFFGLIVGGPAADLAEYKTQAQALALTESDVLFTGEVPADRVPLALQACDILAMPFPDFPHYRENMSPLKMFEYMAAGKPIITSDLPTIRDVLSEKNAIFCLPGEVASLAHALRTVVQNPQMAQECATNAFELAQEHSWLQRMRRILSEFKD